MLWKFVVVTVLLTLSGDTTSHRTSRAAEVTSDIADAVLEAHNEIRAHVQPEAAAMIQLTYDQQLEDLARAYARKCIWEHSSKASRRNSKYRYIGENLRWSSPATDTKTSLVSAVKSWASEVKDYNYNRNTCARMCGHYTQIVWAKTETVGCAVHMCSVLTYPGPNGRTVPNAQYVVCNYGPGGNINSQKPYVEGRSGSKCPPGKVCLGSGGSRASYCGNIIAMTITTVLFIFL